MNFLIKAGKQHTKLRKLFLMDELQLKEIALWGFK